MRYNSEWSDKLTFQDVIKLASNFTVQQMLVRDMFERRIKDEKPIYLHEFLYPLMQGYDCVAMDVDGELGGNDQTFNMLAGRTLMKALKNKEVRRIILTRPAVEAGENLGFLPGDLKEKLDPYMQPLYDALRDMIPHEKLDGYIEKGIIQIAPLAFMRGRTLDNAFVILDEGQNTTHAQMKMFLTRMGKNAKFLLTGDPGQIDLPRRTISGLKEALLILKDVDGVGMIFLDDKDVIRHKLVKKVIAAYKNIEHRE